VRDLEIPALVFKVSPLSLKSVDIDRFKGSPIGRLVPIEGYDARYHEHYKHVAYVADPLRSSVDLDQATWSSVTDAMLAIGRLDAAALRLPNPSLIVRPAIRKEAVSTSALEGTYAAFSDVLEADFLEEGELSSSVLEVRNYVRAAEKGFALIGERPISRNLIAELQAVLVKGTRGDSYEAGQLRQKPVLIGPDGCRVMEARFVPCPPGDELEVGVSDWEKWVNADDDIPLLVKVALAHYQFETLHPFNDGNGRLGRLIAILQLVAAGALAFPVLNISPWLEVRRSAYQDHLATVSETGDFNPWVSFFAQAVRAQSDDGVRRVDGLIHLKDVMVGRLRTAGVRSVAIPIAEDLIGFPVISPTMAAEMYEVTYQTANTAIARLVELEVLEQIGTRPYARLFRAPAVMRLLES